MSKKDWYIVKDLEVFVDATRAIVFNNFGKQQNESWGEIGLDTVAEEERDEFNKILSHSESMLIAKSILRKQTNKTTSSIRYLVSDSIYLKFVESLNERMVGNILNGLVNKGLVDVAYDEEIGDFTFWCVDQNDKTKNKKPKTD